MSTIINIYSSIKSTLSLLLSLSALYNMEIPISTIPMDTRMEVDSENHRKNEKLVTMGELHQEFFGQKNDKAKRCSELVRSNGKEYVHQRTKFGESLVLIITVGTMVGKTSRVRYA